MSTAIICLRKQKEDDEKRRQEGLMRLKLANQRKFTGTLLPSNALYSGDVDVVSFSTGQVMPESGMETLSSMDRLNLLVLQNLSQTTFLRVGSVRNFQTTVQWRAVNSKSTRNILVLKENRSSTLLG